MKNLNRKIVYPLKEFCKDENCEVAEGYEFDLENGNGLNSIVRRKNCEKNCMGYRYYEGSRNGNKPA